MNAYKKLSDFKKKLNDGGYDAVAGARRGAGKFKGWSAADRAAADRAIDAYFGVEAGEAAPKKKVGKRGGKKAVAKAGRKPGRKKAMAAKTVAKTGKRRGRPPRALGERTPVTDNQDVRAEVMAESLLTRTPVVGGRSVDPQAVSTMSMVVGTTSEALKSIKLSRELHSKPGSFDTEIETAGRVLTKAVNTLNNLMDAADKPAADKKGGRGRKAAKAAPAASEVSGGEEELAVVEEDISHLSPEEQEKVQRIRDTEKNMRRFPPGVKVRAPVNSAGGAEEGSGEEQAAQA